MNRSNFTGSAASMVRDNDLNLEFTLWLKNIGEKFTSGLELILLLDSFVTWVRRKAERNSDDKNILCTLKRIGNILEKWNCSTVIKKWL